MAVKQQSRTETKQKKNLNIREEMIDSREICKFDNLSNMSELLFKVFGNEPTVE